MTGAVPEPVAAASMAPLPDDNDETDDNDDNDEESADKLPADAS